MENTPGAIAPTQELEIDSLAEVRELATRLGSEVVCRLSNNLYRVLMTERSSGLPVIVLVATGHTACSELTDWTNLQKELGLTREDYKAEVRRG